MLVKNAKSKSPEVFLTFYLTSNSLWISWKYFIFNRISHIEKLPSYDKTVQFSLYVPFLLVIQTVVLLLSSSTGLYTEQLRKFIQQFCGKSTHPAEGGLFLSLLHLMRLELIFPISRANIECTSSEECSCILFSCISSYFSQTNNCAEVKLSSL